MSAIANMLFTAGFFTVAAAYNFVEFATLATATSLIFAYLLNFFE